MSSPRIALFGNRGSVQVAAVRDAVLSEGGTPLLFNIQLAGKHPTPMIMGGGRAMWEGIDFTDIQSIFIRCTNPNTLPAVPPLLNAASYAAWSAPYYREQEVFAAQYSFFSYLSQLGKLVVNPLHEVYIDHDTKAQFYEKLRDNGFPAPRTCMTNSPEAAHAFLDSVGEAVVKPSIGVGSTRVVNEADLPRFAELHRCPCLFQERIEGQTIRVHIVGDKVVLALRIHSDGGVDSRTATTGFSYMELPPVEAERIARCNRFLGLHFAAWDIIESTDGRYYYLDCNPGPFVMWIGPENVQAVFRQLARYLITFAQTGSIESAAARVEPWRP